MEDSEPNTPLPEWQMTQKGRYDAILLIFNACTFLLCGAFMPFTFGGTLILWIILFVLSSGWAGYMKLVENRIRRAAPSWLCWTTAFGPPLLLTLIIIYCYRHRS